MQAQYPGSGPRSLVAAVLTIAVGLATATIAEAKPGDIIVGDSADGTVERLDPKTGDVDLISDSDLLFDPSDSVFAPNGKLYVVDYEAFAGKGGVLKIDPESGATEEFAGGPPFEQPDGIAMGPDGNLYVTDLDTLGDGALFRVEIPSGDVELVSSADENGPELEDPIGVVVPPNGRPIVATFGPTIVEVDPETGELDPIATAADGLTGGAGLARGADKTLFTTGSDGIEAVDPKTGDVELVAPMPSNNGYGIAVDLRGNVVVPDSGDIFVANPRSGAVDPISSAFNFAEGFEVEPPTCDGKMATIVGSPRNDRLKGSGEADVIVGLGGDDRLKGGDGKDRICGGAGKDRVNGGAGRDTCSGGRGRDRIRKCE